jgi:hypothetical protein
LHSKTDSTIAGVLAQVTLPLGELLALSPQLRVQLAVWILNGKPPDKRRGVRMVVDGDSKPDTSLPASSIPPTSVACSRLASCLHILPISIILLIIFTTFTYSDLPYTHLPCVSSIFDTSLRLLCHAFLMLIDPSL